MKRFRAQTMSSVRMMYNQELRTTTLIKVPISHLTSRLFSCFRLNHFKTYSYRTKYLIRKLNRPFPVADQGWRPLQTKLFSISCCIFFFLQKLAKYGVASPIPTNHPPPRHGESWISLSFRVIIFSFVLNGVMINQTLIGN